jgi:hypothetical protein
LARVFVSYANDDHHVASEIHALLVEAGHDVFLDVDRRGGFGSTRTGSSSCTRARRGHGGMRGPTVLHGQSLVNVIEVAGAKALGTRLVPVSVGRRPQRRRERGDITLPAEEHSLPVRAERSQSGMWKSSCSATRSRCYAGRSCRLDVGPADPPTLATGGGDTTGVAACKNRTNTPR